LVEKGVSQAAASIGEQRIDRSAPNRGVQRIDAVRRRQVCLKGFYLDSGTPKQCGGLLDGWLVRGNQKVISLFGASLGQFKSDAGRSAGYDRQWSGSGHRFSPYVHSRIT
jgi:hypothetical protein